MFVQFLIVLSSKGKLFHALAELVQRLLFGTHGVGHVQVLCGESGWGLAGGLAKKIRGYLFLKKSGQNPSQNIENQLWNELQHAQQPRTVSTYSQPTTSQRCQQK